MEWSSQSAAAIIAAALQFAPCGAWAEDRMNGLDETPAASENAENGGSSASRDSDLLDLFSDGPRFPRWTFASVGFNYLELAGVGSQLGKIVRGDREAPGIVFGYSEKFDSHYSLDAYLSFTRMGDLILGNLLAGVKYDFSPFPKTFITPWGGLYLSLNYLDDRSDLEPGESQGENWNGLGLGAAAAVGLSMRLGGDFILQASARKNRFGALALLEDLTGMADRLTTTEYSLMITLVADLEEHDEMWFE